MLAIVSDGGSCGIPGLDAALLFRYICDVRCYILSVPMGGIKVVRMENDGGGRRIGGLVWGEKHRSGGRVRNGVLAGGDRREVCSYLQLLALLARLLSRCNEKGGNEGEQDVSRWANLLGVPNLAH